MAKEVMERRAADNAYLHKDFHAALNRGIEYLHRNFGEQAVKDYLKTFALSWYKPLREKMMRDGLEAVREHTRAIYETEQAEVACEQTDDELIIRVPACPAVTHIRALGHEVSPLFVETTRTVNKALCEGTPYDYECLEYDEETGRSVQRFFRRSS